MVASSHRNVHLPARPIIAALLTGMLKETHRNTDTVQVHRTAMFVMKPQYVIYNVGALRRIFGPRRDEVTGEWRLHNEELNVLYSSPNIVRMIKSRRMRWAGHVARMGEERGRIGSWW